jgi:pimeloyl-ACP methyl ester carboxylesterase
MNRASIFALFFVLILSSMVSAQDDQQQIWYGVLDVGVAKLRLEIRVTKSPDGNYTGSMISRDQGNADMKFDSFKIKDGVMTFEIKAVKASYEGRLDATGNVVNGTFTQFGNENELKFERKTQTAVPKHVETWQGNMEAGPREFEFQLRVFESIDGKRSALLDSFSENLPNIPVELDETEGFNFEVPGTRATYEGNLSEDRKTITGHWLQSGGKFELNFSAIPVSQTRYVNVNRPQTPEPPFDYESIEVCVKSTTDPDVTLAGTLTLPKGDGTFPAAILISGSGPQDRDCTIFGHKSFLVIADHFAKNGIAVLRYDERGIGESTGKFADATSEDLAADVEDLLNWLKNHSGVDTQKLVLIGHSEGGIIAPMIASRREDLATIIVLAGPTVTGEKIVMNQTRKIAAVAGAEELFLDGQDALMKRVIDQLGKGKLDAEFVDEAIEKVKSDMPEDQREKFVLPDAAKARIVALDTPWFKFFLDYDPAPALRAVKCPVLMITGGTDLQVDPDLNLSLAENIFAAQANNDSEVLRLPNLNHLFQTCDTGSPGNYSRIEETFSPIVLEKMVDWIKNVGAGK